MKEIFFEASYESHNATIWSQAVTMFKYGSEKKISKIFDNFVRDEHRKCSRLIVDPRTAERKVEFEKDCPIKFDRFYVAASLNADDLSKFGLFNSCVAFLPTNTLESRGVQWRCSSGARFWRLSHKMTSKFIFLGSKQRNF